MKIQTTDDLPFTGDALERLLDHADQAFDRNLVLLGHPDEIALRRNWDAEAYLAAWPFKGISRPVELDFAVILVQVFMPHYIFETGAELGARRQLH